MEPVIQFTLSQAWTTVLAICGGITCIAAAVAVIARIINAAKKPNAEQNRRLESIEEKLKEYDIYFKNDKMRIEAIEKGNRVTQKAILALLSHGIDGNEIDAMREAKQELHDYLIGR